MRPLQAARFALIWFALSLGVAIASPWVNPQNLQLVCTGASSKLIAAGGDDGTAPDSGPRLDCPGCLFVGAPIAATSTAVFQAPEGGAFPAPVVAPDLIASASAAPLPARGPPLPT